MKKIIFVFTIASMCYGQLTLMHNGIERNYYVSYPSDASEPCPLIINMHGFGSNALEQQGYSGMNNFAHGSGMAVVYPNGINNAWNVGTNWDNTEADDVDFIRVLIDSVAKDFNIDLDRVYACGMSNGGYMAYELACELSDKIAAFGSVTGNFMLNADQVCDHSRDIPIIHLHGTQDPTVPYTYSYDESLFVSEAIDYWRNQNGLDLVQVEAIPDSDTTDNTTVEKYTYYTSTSNTQFIHYKVDNGGHQWFGSTLGDWFIDGLGNNNHDINANEALIDFFSMYRLSDFLTVDPKNNPIVANQMVLYPNTPNPFNPTTTIRFNVPVESRLMTFLRIYDINGRLVKTLIQGKMAPGYHDIKWDATNENGSVVSTGVYFCILESGNQSSSNKMIYIK